MDFLRGEASRCLESISKGHEYRIRKVEVSEKPTAGDLCSSVHRRDSKAPLTTSQICEDFMTIEVFFAHYKDCLTSEDDRPSINALYKYVSEMLLPSKEILERYENIQLAKINESRINFSGYDISRLKSSLGIGLIQRFDSITPIWDCDFPDIPITALAMLTDANDPWTIEEARNRAISLLGRFQAYVRDSDDNGQGMMEVLGRILEQTVKPLFLKDGKISHPSLTSASRKKDYEATPFRFTSLADDMSPQPWKTGGIYGIPILSWVVSSLKPSDKIENHLSSLVPPILNLVDNEALVYKARGCEVLSKLMKVIEISRSDVLRRTNLDLVFRDALESSLLSLPTLTPEKESLFILSRAYDAVIATLNARYLLKPDGDTQDGLRAFNAEDSRKRLEAFTSLLRERVLHSFNHICTMNNPGDDFIPSFPHPRLSTFLLQQIPPIVFVLKLHTVPLLEDIMSMLIPTLQNPFGSAYPPLLLAAVDATKATILMTWPRIWRWRVLILKGICDCWIQSHRQEEGTGPDSDEHGAICGLRDELRELTAVLKLAVRKCSTTKAVLLECEQEIRVDEEYELLVKEDSGLRDLLISNPYLET